jgi:hypothetical protein
MGPVGGWQNKIQGQQPEQKPKNRENKKKNSQKKKKEREKRGKERRSYQNPHHTQLNERGGARTHSPIGVVGTENQGETTNLLWRKQKTKKKKVHAFSQTDRTRKHVLFHSN